MASPIIQITLDIRPPFDELADDIQGAIIEGAKQGVNFGLDAIAGTQVETYGPNSRPKQPPGSTYQRTFTLQRSSKKIRAKQLGNKISGVWLSQGSIAPYNIEVIGNKQKAIHAGRWLTDKELAIETVDEIQEEINNRIEQILRGL